MYKTAKNSRISDNHTFVRFNSELYIKFSMTSHP